MGPLSPPTAGLPVRHKAGQRCPGQVRRTPQGGGPGNAGIIGLNRPVKHPAHQVDRHHEAPQPKLSPPAFGRSHQHPDRPGRPGPAAPGKVQGGPGRREGHKGTQGRRVGPASWKASSNRLAPTASAATVRARHLSGTQAARPAPQATGKGAAARPSRPKKGPRRGPGRWGAAAVSAPQARAAAAGREPRAGPGRSSIPLNSRPAA